MAFLIPILGFRIRQVFLHWLTALRVITLRPYFCQRFGIERDN